MHTHSQRYNMLPYGALESASGVCLGTFFHAPASHPFFSVCIPAYNSVSAFTRCVESVLGQSEQALECLVHDDSSTHAIQGAVARLNDPRVRYARNVPSLGAPRNWNAVLALARGKIVTLLHQDDWYRFPDVLRRIHEYMEATAADVCVTGRALYERGACLGEYVHITSCQQAFLRDFPAKSLVVNRLGHPSVFFFRNSLKNIPYDEALRYFSDTEYYKRLLENARNVRVLPEALVALERNGDGQFSSQCLRQPETLTRELMYALDKHRAHAVAKGTAMARFCMSHARRWRLGGTVKLLRCMTRMLRWNELFIMLASLPVFLGHMLYRFTYRRITQRPWA